MKKKFFTYGFMIIFMAFTLLPNNIATAQTPKINGLMFDLGYGGAGISTAVGYRWWHFSASLGIAGFANNIPRYAKVPPTGVVISPSQPLPSGFESESYTAIDVFGDLGFHYDFYPYSVFVQAGFYNAQDTILAKNIETGSRYRYATSNESGFSIGLGGEYIFTKDITAGVGFHTRRGVFARFTYTWMKN